MSDFHLMDVSVRGASNSAPTTPAAPASENAHHHAQRLDFTMARLPRSIGFTRILVPLDGSPFAERALPVAVRIAAASRGSLLLVRVVQPQILGDVGGAAVGDAFEASLDVAIDYLRDVARRDDLAGIEVHTKALIGASSSATLLEGIDLYHCDLVVMCSHGRTGFARLALGSVAQQIVRHAPSPVLVLRPVDEQAPAAPPEQSETEPVVRALVALDGSALAEAAILPAARLLAALASSADGSGQPRRAELHILRIIDLSVDHSDRDILTLPYRQVEEVKLEQARTYMYGLAQGVQQSFNQGDLALRWLEVTWSILDDVDAACGVLDEAHYEARREAALARVAGGGTRNAIPFDFIALATHGRTGLRRMALGSVAERVLTQSDLPVLVVRPRA